MSEKIGYLVKLQAFEGPLDLLLHLIRKNKMDIYDIPIAEVTRQYLSYLAAMEQFDIEVASEFIVMAATLMYIKSKMLIPREMVKIEEEIDEDPRAPLVEKLLEYQRFKEISRTLATREEHESHYFTRPLDLSLIEEKLDEPYFELDLLELVKTFNRLIHLINTEPKVREIIVDDININLKIEELTHMMHYQNLVNISELFKNYKTKKEVIAALLALLEMAKNGLIVLQQVELFGEIRGYPAQLSLEVA